MALLTSADFTGLISSPLLVRLTNDTAGASSVDETVIDKVSAAAWDEMWANGCAAAKAAGFPTPDVPTTVPSTGPLREMLRKVTRYGLYSRRPETLSGPEGDVIRIERNDAINLMVTMGKSGTLSEEVSADDTGADGSFAFYSNDVVFDKTTFRGF